MKAFLYKAKGALALALAMSMFCPQVFAAEALSAEEQGVQAAPVVELTEEELAAMALPQLTMEEALAKALKYSPELREIEDTLDYLDESIDDIEDSVGSVKIPNYEYKKWVNDGWQKVVSGIFQMELGEKQAKIRRDIQKLALEVTVKSYFTSIMNNQDNLELVKKNAEIQQKLYEQGYTKYRLGMLSKYNLDQLQVAAQKAKDNVALLETSLEQQYIKLNSLMGESADKRFEYIYDVTFEPYELKLPIDQYISNALNDDMTIEIMELSLESAKFSKNYVGESNTYLDSMKQELDYDTAKRDLKTAKEQKELLLRNAYLQLGQMESMYASAQADLTKAQAEYRVAQVNLQAGNVTKTLVEQAEMGVISAQNALNELVYNYDMLVYTFENPSLLADTGAAAQ